MEAKRKAKSSSVSSTSSTPPATSTVKSSQTNYHEDIPYKVTDPLPPIFSSQLCHFSKPINFFSNSLPNLNTITWVKVSEEDELRDEAEQALCDLYDRDLELYYREAAERSRAVKEVYDERLIEKLFEEDFD